MRTSITSSIGFRVLVRVSVLGMLVAGIVGGFAAPAVASTTSTISGHLSLGAGRTAPDVPAGDAKVTYQLLQGSSWSGVLGEAVVTSGGLYSIPGLADGTYLLRFVYLGSGGYGSVYYGSTVDPNQASRVVLAGANQVVNGSLPAPSTISGTVYLETTAHPAASGDVTVSLVEDTPVTEVPETVATTTTDASGHYQFINVPSDVYYEVVATPAHDASYGTTSVSVHAFSGGSYPGNDITMARSYTLTGHISLGTAGVSAGAGVVRVSISGALTGVPQGENVSTQTDANGDYAFSGLPSTRYTVSLAYSGSGDFATTYTVPSAPSSSCGAACTFDPADSASSAVSLDVTLPVGAHITGTVTDASGKPLSGITVYVGQVGVGSATDINSFGATTGPDGKYTVVRLPSGTFHVQFSGGAYEPVWWNSKVVYQTGDPIVLSSGAVASGINGKLTVGSMIDGVIDIHGGAQADLDGGAVTFQLQYFDTVTNSWSSIGGGPRPVLEYDDQPGIEHYVGEGQYSTSEMDPTVSWRVLVIYQTAARFGEWISPTINLTPGVTFHIRGTVNVGLAFPSAGALVKSVDPTQPRIYLVDGSARLVPIDSFDSVSAMGLSTSFSPVDPTLITGRSIASAALGGIVTCAGVDYVAGSGELWPVAPNLVTTLPATTLDPTTCAIIPKATLSFTHALFVKSASDPTIYYVDSTGHKVAMSSFAQMNQLSAPDPANYIVASDSFLNSLPIGPSIVLPGQLIKSTAGPTIYLVDGSSKLVPIAFFDQASAMGLSTSWTAVTPVTITSRTVTSGSLGSVISCSGTDYVGGSGALWPVAPAIVAALPVVTLDPTTCAVIPKSGQTLGHALFVKSASDPTIFYVDSTGKKDAVYSFATIAQLSSPDPSNYLVVAAGFISSLPTGPDLIPAGSLVKSASSPVIYLVDGAGGLIPVASFTTVTDMGLSTSYTTVSASSIISVTASALTNLVSCTGQKLIAGAGELWPIASADAGSLPFSTLPASLCSVIPTSTTSLSPTLIRSATSGVIYHLTTGKKVALTPATLAALLAGAPLVYVNMNDAYLASIPNG